MIAKCQHPGCCRLYDTTKDDMKRWYWGDLVNNNYNWSLVDGVACSINDIRWCPECIAADKVRVFGEQEKLQKEFETQQAKDQTKKNHAIILESQEKIPYDPNKPKKQLTISDLVKKWGKLINFHS